MKRLVFVLNIPSPYRVTLLEEVARQAAARGYAFEAHFMSHGHQDRPDSWRDPKMCFPHRYWRDWGRGTHHFNPGLLWHLLLHRMDALVVGSPFDTFTGIGAAFVARARKKCTWVEGQTKTPGRLDGAIGILKRVILSRFRFVAVPGHDAVRYIALHQARTSLSMPQCVVLPNLIDATRFAPLVGEAKVALKAKCYGVGPSVRVCLIPARLTAVKGLIPFLEELPAGLMANWRIVLMGQGDLQGEIQHVIDRRGLGASVQIRSYVPYAEMPKFYSAADLLLLPSLHDPNPLAVPEALHSGLAVALSDQAGNVEEAVSEGSNGWRLPVRDASAMKVKLAEIFGTDMVRLHQMGRNSKTKNALFWDSVRAVGSFLDCIGVNVK